MAVPASRVMANRTRQRIRRRHGHSVQGRFAGDDGSLSDVVARLFADPERPAAGAAALTSRDDLPVEEICNVVASIVASSQAGPPPADTPDRTVHQSAAPASLVRAPPPEADGDIAPSPAASVQPAWQDAPAAADAPVMPGEAPQRRRRGWVLATVAATGLSVSALAVMLGLQRTPGEDTPTGSVQLADNAAGPEAHQIHSRSGGGDVQSASLPSAAASTQPERAREPVSETGNIPSRPDALPARELPPTPGGAQREEAVLASLSVAVAEPPSLKPPRRLADPDRRVPEVAMAPTLASTPALPDHVHNGNVIEGSAVAAILEVIDASGERLTEPQRREIASRIERALTRELDGRTAMIETPAGQVAEVSLHSSRRQTQDIAIPRASHVGLVGSGLTVEGGWFASRGEITVRPMPDLQTGLSGEPTAPAGTLFERLGTVVSPYGDRWYLVGEAGVAQGYVPAADVSPVDTFSGALGQPYDARPAARVEDKAAAMTTCRTFTVNLEGYGARDGSACRHASGAWLAEAAPPAPDLARRLADQDGLGHVLAGLEAAGDPEMRDQLAREVNAIIEQGFENARLEVPAGDGTLSLELGGMEAARRAVAMRRAAEVAPVRSDMTLGHGWVSATRDTQLRPVPSQRTRLSDGAIAADTKMQLIGLLGDGENSDWAIVGRRGVALGYVQLADLQWAETPRELRYSASLRMHGRVVQEHVNATTQCQTLRLGQSAPGAGLHEICNRPDGTWALSQAARRDTAGPATRPVSL